MVWNGLNSRRYTLWEQQNRKCIACGVNLTSHKHSGRAKIGDDDFVACMPCVSHVGEYQTLADFVEDHASGTREARLAAAREERAANRVENPEGYAKIVAYIREHGGDESIIRVPDHFRYLPADAKFSSIAYHLINGNLSVEERAAREKSKTARRRAKRGSPSVNKQLLGEAQNHHCVYCHCDMHYEKTGTFKDWYYATYEHVLTVTECNRSEFNKRANLVMACAFCNRERDRLHMTAEDFYNWVQANKQSYEKRRELMPQPPFISKLRWLKLKSKEKRLQNRKVTLINIEPMLTNVK